MGSLKYTGRGAPATEDVVIFNQIDREGIEIFSLFSLGMVHEHMALSK